MQFHVEQVTRAFVSRGTSTLLSIFFFLWLLGTPPLAATDSFAWPKSCADWLIDVESHALDDAMRNLGKNYTDVGTCEAASVLVPKQCGTLGVGPCIAVGILDLENRTAHLYHSPSNPEWNAFFIASALKGTDPQKVRAILVGGVDAYEYGTMDHFRKAVEQLRAFGLPDDQIVGRFAFQRTDDGCYSLLLDPETGRVYIDFWAVDEDEE